MTTTTTMTTAVVFAQSTYSATATQG